MSGAIPLLSLYAFMTCTGTNLPPTHDSPAYQHKLTPNIFTTFKTICTSFRYIQQLYIFAHCSVSSNAVFVIFNLVSFHLHISINSFLGNTTKEWLHLNLIKQNYLFHITLQGVKQLNHIYLLWFNYFHKWQSSYRWAALYNESI